MADFTELIDGYGVAEIRDYINDQTEYILDITPIEIGSADGLIYWLTDSGAVYLGGSLLEQETGTASQDYSYGDYFANEFNYPCKIIADVSEGDTLTVDVNYKLLTINFNIATINGGDSVSDMWEAREYVDVNGDTVTALFQKLEIPEEPEGASGASGESGE